MLYIGMAIVNSYVCWLQYHKAHQNRENWHFQFSRNYLIGGPAHIESMLKSSQSALLGHQGGSNSLGDL